MEKKLVINILDKLTDEKLLDDKNIWSIIVDYIEPCINCNKISVSYYKGICYNCRFNFKKN
jgi:hypothetical protein